MHNFLRRPVQTVLVTGGLAVIAFELAGAVTAAALAVVALASSPSTPRPSRWAAGRRPSTVTEVPTQRSAPRDR